MKDSKALLQHKLLNIITILNIWFEEKDFKDLSRPIGLLKLAGLIVAYEKAFLSQKFEFFIQSFNVTDIIHITISSFDEIISEKNINVINFEDDVLIDSDRYFFSEAMNQVFTTLLKNSSNIEFSYIEKSKSIEITHDGILDEGLVNQDLISSLDQKDIDTDEIGFLLAINIFNQLQKPLKIEKNKITIDVSE